MAEHPPPVDLSLPVILALTVALHAAFSGMRITMSLSALHMGASPLTVGVIMSLLAALPALYSLPAGRWIDRVGVRTPMLLSAGLTCAGAVLAAAVPQLSALFGVSLLASAFMLYHIAVHHAVGTMASDPAKRVHNFSVLALSFATSAFIGPMSAGFSIDALGYRWSFALMAVLAGCVFAAMWFVKFEAPDHATAGHGGGARNARELMRNPELRKVFVASTLLSMTWDLFTFVVPIHGNRIGLSASKIGAIIGVFGIAIFIVRLLMPFIGKRVREWQLLTMSVLVSAGTFVVLPLVHSAGLLALLGFVLGLGLGAAQPMIMSLLYTNAPKGRSGEAIGIRSLLLNSSQTGIPLLFGALGTALGMIPVFWTAAGLLAAGCYYTRRRGA